MSQSYGFTIELRVIILCLLSASNSKCFLDEVPRIVWAVKLFSLFLRKSCRAHSGFTGTPTTHGVKHPLTTNQLRPLLSGSYFLMTSAVYDAWWKVNSEHIPAPATSPLRWKLLTEGGFGIKSMKRAARCLSEHRGYISERGTDRPPVQRKFSF